jgi:hypothetical protein
VGLEAAQRRFVPVRDGLLRPGEHLDQVLNGLTR